MLPTEKDVPVNAPVPDMVTPLLTSEYTTVAPLSAILPDPERTMCCWFVEARIGLLPLSVTLVGVAGGVASTTILPVASEVSPRVSVKVAETGFVPFDPVKVTENMVRPDPEILPVWVLIDVPVNTYVPVFVEVSWTLVVAEVVVDPERNVIDPTGAPDVSFVSEPVHEGLVLPTESCTATFIAIVPFGRVVVFILPTEKDVPVNAPVPEMVVPLLVRE